MDPERDEGETSKLIGVRDKGRLGNGLETSSITLILATELR